MSQTQHRDRRGRASAEPVLGIVLPGGAARGAYQVGVLAGLAELYPPDVPVPFQVISGTSAGAMSAAFLASRMREFRATTEQLATLWGNLTVDKIYYSHYRKILAVVLRWMWSFMVGGLGESSPRALFDNRPLAKLLQEQVDFRSIQPALDEGLLHGIAITVTGYASERSFSYFQAHPGIEPWWRERREGRPGVIGLEHIMASLALPVMFPAVEIDREWCGDGSIREYTPLSPAIHLGADRVLIIDTQYRGKSESLRSNGTMRSYPSVPQISAFLLDTIFSDSLYADLERVERFNRTLAHLPPATVDPDRPRLRPIDTLLMVPSLPPEKFAERHIEALPRSIRWFLRSLGGDGEGGERLLSYMLFEGVYTHDLIELGRKDVRARSEELQQFLGISKVRVHKI